PPDLLVVTQPQELHRSLLVALWLEVHVARVHHVVATSDEDHGQEHGEPGETSHGSTLSAQTLAPKRETPGRGSPPSAQALRARRGARHDSVARQGSPAELRHRAYGDSLARNSACVWSGESAEGTVSNPPHRIAARRAG